MGPPIFASVQNKRWKPAPFSFWNAPLYREFIGLFHLELLLFRARMIFGRSLCIFSSFVCPIDIYHGISSSLSIIL